MANDRIADLAKAFLTSFRRHNPTIPLCLIPYDNQISEIEGLRTRYSFEIFEDEARCRWCDDLSFLYHGKAMGQYRKLAAWFGAYDEFIYVDCDVIVLSEFSLIYDFLREFDVIVSHSNIPSIRKWVWKDTAVQEAVLPARQIAFSANTGFICSRRHLFTGDDIKRKAHQGLSLKRHMELLCAEQPFLNYLWMTSLLKCTSLRNIAKQRKRYDIPLELWAGNWRHETRDGKVTSLTQNPILLVHWAGEWLQDRHLTNPLWRYYRDLTSDRDLSEDKENSI